MAIVSFSFTKIVAEKKGPTTGKVNISNNVSIKDIEEATLSTGKAKQKILKFVFNFSSVYDPSVGKIEFIGDVLVVEPEKKIKEVLDKWKKEKKVQKDVLTPILNTVLARCNIEAIVISRDIGLPPPLPLPKVDAKATEKGDYIG